MERRQREKKECPSSGDVTTCGSFLYIYLKANSTNPLLYFITIIIIQKTKGFQIIYSRHRTTKALLRQRGKACWWAAALRECP